MHRIVKCKKPHTIAEELILPAAVDLATTMIAEGAAQKLILVPLSNDTMCRRIDDIYDQLIDQMKEREFSLQLNEVTDNSRDAHLICYVLFVDFSEQN